MQIHHRGADALVFVDDKFSAQIQRFLYYWSLGRGNQRSPMNSVYK